MKFTPDETIMKLTALMEGLEIKDVSLFIKQAKIGDYRNLGKRYLKAVDEKLQASDEPSNCILTDVSKRTFDRSDKEIEQMACEIDKFIQQVLKDEKAGTYFRNLTTYLAKKFNEYVC